MRGLVIIFAVTALTAIAVATINFQRRGLERHPQDIQLRDIERMHGPVERLMLSDSVTENATRNILFAPGTLPLLTHGWMRLAGDFLLLQRVLARGPVRAMDLFLLPDMLVVDVNDEAQGRIRQTYTDTLFTRRDEIEELRRGGDTQAGTRLVFFELIYKSLEPGQRRLAPREELFVHSFRPVTPELTDPARAYIDARKKVLTPPRITDQNRYFLMRFSEVCRAQAIACRIIVEPLPISIPRLGVEALSEAAPGIEIFDINAVETFPDGAFRDGLHLTPEWEGYYRSLLAQHGLMQFANSLPADRLLPWDGTKIAFRETDPRLPLQNVYAAEPWGRWSSGRIALSSFRLDGPTAGRDLSLEVTALVRKGPQTVRLSINGQAPCEQVLEHDGDATITCPLPTGINGSVALRIETSYASSPREWGAADDRQLGIGLRALSVSPAR